MQVVFDRPLRAAVLNTANWSGRIGLARRAAIGPVIALNRVVRFALGFPVPEAGGDVVDYAPPPFDLQSLHGVTAPAFADFPVTLLP